MSMTYPLRPILTGLLIAGALAGTAHAQLLRKTGAADAKRPGLSREDLNAKSIIDTAEEAFRVGQEERGIKALGQVALQYPESTMRFRAFGLLGQHYVSKRQYEAAVTEFWKVLKTEDDDEYARALTAIGVCQYNQNAYDKAVMTLRQVINKFPGHPAINDAYYHIGLCHFHHKRWAKALEAFELVGTSVADREDEGEVLAEAGRRLFVRVKDKDLSILTQLGHKPNVVVSAASGDEETVLLEALGRTREDFVASVRTTPEASPPGDGVLRIRGGDSVEVHYLDKNTRGGHEGVRRLSRMRLVSTAGLAITDGAYGQTVSAIGIEQPIFIRLKDLDLDRAETPDETRVQLTSFREVRIEQDIGEGTGVIDRGVDLADDGETFEWITRSTARVKLTESGGATGIFTTRVVPHLLQGEDETGPEGKLWVRPGDRVVVTYVDKEHLNGEDPVELEAAALVIETGSPRIENVISQSSNPDIQAQKLLLEAQLLHMLASIFKEMGLLDRAAEKADAGIERVEDITKLYTVHALSRNLIEEAFEAKWNLYLDKNELGAAIATCKALLSLFPDSVLADQAFMNIGRAYLESEKPEVIRQAIPVLQLVIAMPESVNRAEASYLVARAYRRMAEFGTTSRRGDPLAATMAQFRRVAEQFPDSPFAAEALKELIKYYFKQGEYGRSVEMLEQICQDYQDQEWLHEMVLLWGVAHLRLGNRDTGMLRLQQVMHEYPSSDSADKASQIIAKLGGASQTE